MKLLKSVIVGLGGSLIMFMLMMVGIHGLGIAPFNIPPSAAFLTSMDLNVGPLPLLVHFGYGAFWSAILIGLAKTNTNIKKGLMLSIFLWLIMMVIYSPIMGWGFFGFGSVDVAPTSTLYLENGPKYMLSTLMLHLFYGITVGWLNRVWTLRSENQWEAHSETYSTA